MTFKLNLPSPATLRLIAFGLASLGPLTACSSTPKIEPTIKVIPVSTKIVVPEEAKKDCLPEPLDETRHFETLDAAVKAVELVSVQFLSDLIDCNGRRDAAVQAADPK